jgi:hypothetical protein
MLENRPERTRQPDRGNCEACGQGFDYYLIHNGFNESTYAYCSQCGMTAVLDTEYEDRSDIGLPPYRSILPSGERLLAPCACGGMFSAGAAPRCPHCRAALSPRAATEYIEANAPGTKAGWRWQGTWIVLYCIVIEDRIARNPWKPQ